MYKITIRLGFIFSLFARFERQRPAKLNRNAAQEVVYLIDPADVSGTGEIGHVKRVVLAVAGHAKASGYLLAEIGTGVVCPAGKRSTSAGKVDHLALGELSVEVLGEPDRPVVSQSLFCSSVDVIVHTCKSADSQTHFTRYGPPRMIFLKLKRRT